MHSASALSCVLALPLFLCPSAVSQTPAAPATDQSKYATEPYVIEHFNKTYRFEADGKGQKDLSIRIRIQSESAVREFGLLVYSYMSSFESLEVLYARVRKPDGSVVDTPSSETQELDSAVSREAPMYTDQREKHIAVKSLSVGDVLEVSVRWTIHDPISPGHFWEDEEFFDKGICLDQTIQFNVPASVAVKLTGSNPAPQVKEDGGRRIYTFRTSHLKKVEEDENQKIPDWEKDFHGSAPLAVRITSFSSWADVGAWYAGLQQPRVRVTPRIRSTAEDITKGKTTEDEKIRAIYDYVSSRFRYIGIDLGLGRYTPHAAEDVLSNRYGDCKDKHTLFAALLEAVGVHAYPALISSKFKLDPDVPSPSLFDHVLTAIPRGDSYLFLDTTPEVAPFGLLMAGFRDRQVLVMPNNAPAKLVSTPPESPVSNLEKFRMDATLDSQGTLDGKARFEERGDGEVLLRLLYRNTPQNQWKELTQAFVGRLGFGGTVSEVAALQPEKTSEPFWLSYDYHRTDYSGWKESRISLPIPPQLLPELNEAQKKSKDPLPLGLQEIISEASVKLPPTVRPFLPPAVQEKYDFAEYTGTYRFEKGVLSGARHLVIKKREIPGTQRADYSSLVKAIQDDLSKWIPLLPQSAEESSPARVGWNLLNEGKTADAVALLEKAASDDPSNQLLAFTLGRAYLRVPDEAKAVAQFQKLLGEKPSEFWLNGVAYEYASANTRLAEAVDFATRAVSSASADSMKPTLDTATTDDFLRMGSLAAEWDTLGWAKFRAGDPASAEKYLQAAWELTPRAVVGAHLTEVYEKLGKERDALQICDLALAAPGLQEEPGTQEKLLVARKRLNSAAGETGTVDAKHYRQPLYGSKNLSDMRTFKLPRKATLGAKSKIALFAIALENGSSAAKARLVSGDKELQPEAQALAALNYRQHFPDDVPARILRAGYVSCSQYVSDCTLILFLANDKPSLDMVKPKEESAGPSGQAPKLKDEGPAPKIVPPKPKSD